MLDALFTFIIGLLLIGAGYCLGHCDGYEKGRRGGEG